MSTPAIRAMWWLPLPLLVTRVRADDLDAPVAADHLAVVAHLLDARTYFHVCLLVAIGDSAAGEVVRRQLHLDAIPGQDADVVHAHLSGDVSEDLVSIVELHAKHRVGERFGDLPFQHDGVFLGLGQLSTFLVEPGMRLADRRLRSARQRPLGPANQRTGPP